MRSWNMPGSSAGTVTFRSSTVGVQALEDADAVASFPDSVQTRLPAEALNGVCTASGLCPFSKVVGCLLLGWTRRELVLRADSDRHDVVGRIVVSPVRDVRLSVVEEDAFEHWRDRLRLRLLLGLVRDRADDGVAAPNRHGDHCASRGDARSARAPDRDRVVVQLRPAGARLADSCVPGVTTTSLVVPS